MGAVEGYVDKVVANRMKKRGMRWSLAGADAMARLLAKHSNDELAEFAARHTYWESREKGKSVLRMKEKAGSDPGAWLRKAAPVLYGPHAARPWVMSVRRMLGG